jgi:hypothetical protein
MAFTLATLKTAIQDFVQNDETTFASQLDNIIRQVEERINYAVRIQNYNTKVTTGDLADQDASVVISGTGPGVAEGNVTSPIAPLYFKIREGADVTTNAWQFLLLKDYNFLQEYAPVTDDTTDGTPKYYSFYNDVGNDGLATFSFSPRVDAAYDYEILYFFNPTSLVTDTSGTWLSTHGESALLYGCLLESYKFMKGDAELLALYDQRFKESLKILINGTSGQYRTDLYRSPVASSSGVAA